MATATKTKGMKNKAAKGASGAKGEKSRNGSGGKKPAKVPAAKGGPNGKGSAGSSGKGGDPAGKGSLPAETEQPGRVQSVNRISYPQPASRAGGQVGVAQQNGHLTKADEYRRKVSSELAEAYRTLGRANSRYESLKSQTKGAKGEVEAAQREVNDLVSELRDIESGQYQPDLFDSPRTSPAGGSSATSLVERTAAAKAKSPPTPTDEGAALPISAFTEFGLTESQVECLSNAPCHPKTIGEFEEWTRRDKLWMTKIPGMGEKTVERLRDAWVELRLTYPPVPDPDGVPSETEMQAESEASSGSGSGSGSEAANSADGSANAGSEPSPADPENPLESANETESAADSQVSDDSAE